MLSNFALGKERHCSNEDYGIGLLTRLWQGKCLVNRPLPPLGEKKWRADLITSPAEPRPSGFGGFCKDPNYSRLVVPRRGRKARCSQTSHLSLPRCLTTCTSLCLLSNPVRWAVCSHLTDVDAETQSLDCLPKVPQPAGRGADSSPGLGTASLCPFLSCALQIRSVTQSLLFGIAVILGHFLPGSVNMRD